MKNFFFFNKFREHDAFSQAVQGWDLDFMQLDRGKFKADVLQAATARSLFGYGSFNRSFDQRGSSPPGVWTFAIFSGLSTQVIWRELEISNCNMVIYRPGSEIDCVSRPGFEVYTCSFTEDHLDLICAKLRLSGIKKLVGESEHIRCKIEDLVEGRKLLRNITQSLTSGLLSIDDANLTFSLEQELPETILSILFLSTPTARIRPKRRTDALRKVKEHLAEYPQDPVTVQSLCSLTGVSERTLQYAFLDHYGISPKTYLKNFRMYGVRKEILRGDSITTKINEIAYNWGFWHMGQFAADYRKLFGELPSETLRQVT